jgi:pimeloyl-CoA synthetase
MINSQNIPHLIKYMGAKREILEYVTESIQNLNVYIAAIITNKWTGNRNFHSDTT